MKFSSIDKNYANQNANFLRQECKNILLKAGSWLPSVFQFKENNVTLKKIIHLLQYVCAFPLRYSENFK